MPETAIAPLPRITILLCTWNGADYLQEQLNSYLAQDHQDWDLWVSDDGSTDQTRNIITAFRDRVKPQHKVCLVDGPRQGAAQNFLSLLCHPDLPLDSPVALSDQDDVWLPNKLSRALQALHQSPPVTLYGAQITHVDQNLQVIGRSRPPRRAPGFCNALTQNIVSGNSTVLSPEALALVRKAGRPGPDIPYHDWWLYQLVSGCGGHIAIDPEEVMLYRQHDGNVMGAHQGWRATFQRMQSVLGREYGNWIEANTQALTERSALLTKEARTALSHLQAAKRGRPIGRIRAFARAGLYRQTLLATVVLYLAAGLGRI